MTGNLLTILVTTYNRAIVLDRVLALLADYQAQGLSFNILVSDDCSTDNTLDTCKHWEKTLRDFSVIQTPKNQGMDYNFRNVYENFDTPYCWLLGDTRHISFDGLKSILDALSTNHYDALILRCREEMPQERIVYNNVTTLMSQQGWHITNNASCVIPKRFIRPVLYQRYMGTTFLHMGIFVENICLLEKFNVLYMGDVYITELDVHKAGWNKHPFLNFGKLWYTFIMSLPNQIPLSLKQQVIYDHNTHTHILDLKKMPASKVVYGKVFVDNYRACRQWVPFVSHAPLWAYDLIILHTPTVVLRILHSTYKRFIQRKQ